ncbi:hypothetical protein PPL_07002 [Heterostelium album PN500]|uniref:Tetratricopeptide SHNi-TPR domain-containing protein n=1 Tax=Heterostelium pallidum (strain ATCC 26659 / Pp 5 / PN500) TaxID=670386 RepID=D3BE49_HETP5|nr:hypothetical protein PPL_07002 [Heterostelium album PN500]EFA80180.1 hypothetical protein PPL_07002 [Heterostelium album PN500]|eukprot:XP_020432300.1 hypothetical protein PPL_07002 [Heterostelium album PN500]
MDSTTTTTTTSTTSTNSNVNIQRDTEVANAKGKIIVAQSLYDEGDFVSCCELLGSCLSTLTEIHGEMSIDVAPVYVKYGRALLFSYKTNESDVLGSKLQDQEQEQEQSSESETETTKSAAKSKTKTVLPKEDSIDDKPHLEEDDDEEEEEEEGTTTTAAATTSNNNNNENEDDPRITALKQQAQSDAETLELSWEVIELARLIYEKDQADNGTNRYKELSDIHMLIADVLVELENLDDALKEYEYALELRKKNDKENERTQAEVLYYIGLVYQIKNESKLAEDAYRRATDILSKSLERLQNMPEPPIDDIQDLKNVMFELQLKLDEVVPIDTSKEPVPKELENAPTEITISTSASDQTVAPGTEVKRLGTVGKATKKLTLDPTGSSPVKQTSTNSTTTTTTAPAEENNAATKSKRRLEDMMSGGESISISTGPTSTPSSAVPTPTNEVEKKQKVEH